MNSQQSLSTLSCFSVPQGGAVDEWLERLGYGAEVAVKRKFEAGLRHETTGKLSLSAKQKMGTFFELGKAKAAKGEGWAPPSISCAQDTVGLYPPTPTVPMVIRLWEPLPLPVELELAKSTPVHC